MKGFVQFMASVSGRVVRIVAGLALIAWGFLGLGGTEAYVISAIGAIPLLAGILDICIFGPLFGCPLEGKKVRHEA